MAQPPSNSRKKWTDDEISRLKKMAKRNLPKSLIAFELNRTEASVQAKTQSLGISLKSSWRS